MEDQPWNQVLQVVEEWVSRHPRPNAAALSIAQGRSYSPRELLEELQSNGPSSFFGQLIQQAQETKGLEALLDSFRAAGRTQQEVRPHV